MRPDGAGGWVCAMQAMNRPQTFKRRDGADGTATRTWDGTYGMRRDAADGTAMRTWDGTYGIRRDGVGGTAIRTWGGTYGMRRDTTSGGHVP